MKLDGLSYDEAISRMRGSPTSSFWLRGAVAALEARDPLDALNDAEVLAQLSRKRFDETVANAADTTATAGDSKASRANGASPS